jgi:hypothetical protein
MNAPHSEIRDADRIAHDYYKMGVCISIIDNVIADTDEDSPYGSSVEKKACVDRNVRHLELMVARDDWGLESMTTSNSAITAGKAYIG